MAQPVNRSSIIILLAIFGIGAFIPAFWAVGLPVYVIAIMMGVGLISWGSAFFLYLRQRDHAREAAELLARRHDGDAPIYADLTTQELSIYTLQPGDCYVIKQSFVDCFGNRFEQGQRLTFRKRHFLPYHGGHTIVFAERSLYLQEDQNRSIIDEFSRYIVGCQRREEEERYQWEK
jgi:hypothetical protein